MSSGTILRVSYLDSAGKRQSPDYLLLFVTI